MLEAAELRLFLRGIGTIEKDLQSITLHHELSQLLVGPMVRQEKMLPKRIN